MTQLAVRDRSDTLMLPAAAKRDPEVFKNPDWLPIPRSNGAHLSCARAADTSTHSQCAAGRTNFGCPRTNHRSAQPHMARLHAAHPSPDWFRNCWQATGNLGDTKCIRQFISQDP